MNKRLGSPPEATFWPQYERFSYAPSYYSWSRPVRPLTLPPTSGLWPNMDEKNYTQGAQNNYTQNNFAQNNYSFDAHCHCNHHAPSCCLASQRTAKQAKDENESRVVVEELASSSSTADADETNLNQTQSDFDELRNADKELIETLKDSLEDAIKRHRDSQLLLLRVNQKLAFNHLEECRKNVDRNLSAVRTEFNRFNTNAAMTRKLNALFVQLNQAKDKIKAEKKRIKNHFKVIEESLKENIQVDIGSIEYPAMPQYPDPLDFYKCILDEIPLVFLNDLPKLKKLAGKVIQNADFNQVNGVDEALACDPQPKDTFPYSGPKEVPNFSSLKEVPNASVFSLFNESEKSLNVMIATNADASQSMQSRVPTPKTASITTPPLMGPSPTFPLNPVLLNSSSPKLQTDEIGVQMPSFASVTKASIITETLPKEVASNLNGRLLTQTSTMNTMKAEQENENQSKNQSKKLSQSQTKLLLRLKEKYPRLSESVLIDSINQTKTLLTKRQNLKGFTGMKVSDIIAHISHYIENNVTLYQDVVKSLPSLNLLESNTSDMKNENELPPKVLVTPIKKMKWSAGGSQSCPICKEEMKAEETFQTDCLHTFCKPCIINWLKSDKSCPICSNLVLPPGEYPHL